MRSNSVSQNVQTTRSTESAATLPEFFECIVSHLSRTVVFEAIDVDG